MPPPGALEPPEAPPPELELVLPPELELDPDEPEPVLPDPDGLGMGTLAPDELELDCEPQATSARQASSSATP